jgi:hypothetical protein
LIVDHGEQIAGIIPKDLIGRSPRLYHMAEADTWDSIREHGLLSTSALLDLFEIKGDVKRILPH